MNENIKTFGQAISQARKQKALSQKELSQQIMREDGQPISPQYLNDIEHDRRCPSSTQLINEFSNVLNLDKDWLFFLADRFPEDIRQNLNQDAVAEIMVAFRKSKNK